MMARAITSGELTKLRSDNQWSQLYLAIIAPSTVYSAQVNQSTFDDPVSEITFDNATGTAGDVLPGMTIWVGSSAGDYDLGMCRVRKAISGSTLYVGRDSEIDWADNLYLTIVDDFGLWAKPPALDTDGVSELVDTDIAYSDQHANPDPVPVLGPDAVAWLPNGGTVDVDFDGSTSWVLGGTITAYSWSAPGASATSGLATSSPTITYDTAGRYRVACTVTASNGSTFTGYRYVYVFDDSNMPITQFTLEDCSGSFDDGYWRARLTMLAEAGLALVHDRARAILFAKDYYIGVESELGPVSGRENVIMAGWIAGETISQSPYSPEVTFEIQGPGYWLDRIEAFPIGIEDTYFADNGGGAADRWTEFDGLTMDTYLWHLCHWRSTVDAVIDVVLTGDTRAGPSLESTADTLLEQLKVADLRVLARPLCDRYGRLFIEIDPQYLSTTDRDSLPVVMTITQGDWQEPADIERVTAAEVSLLEVSGVAYDGAGNLAPYFSQAPGIVFSRLGKADSLDNLLLADQDDANSTAARGLGKMRNPYPSLTFRFAMNNRFIDIAPRQYCKVTVAAGDTLRGFAFTDKRLIARSITYSQDADTGLLSAEIEFEGEADILKSVTVIKDTGAEVPGVNVPPAPPIPDFPPYPGGTYGPPPTIVPIPPTDYCKDSFTAPANGPFPLYLAGTILRSDDPTKLKATGNMPCIVRVTGNTYKTKVLIDGCFYQSFDDGVSWQTSPDMRGIVISAHNYGVPPPSFPPNVTDDIYADNTLYGGKQCEYRGGYFSPGEIKYLEPPGGFDIAVSDAPGEAYNATSIEHSPGYPSGEQAGYPAPYWIDLWSGGMDSSSDLYIHWQWTCTGIPAGDLSITVKNISTGPVDCHFGAWGGVGSIVGDNYPPGSIAAGDSYTFNMTRIHLDGTLDFFNRTYGLPGWYPYPGGGVFMGFEITDFQVDGVSIFGIVKIEIREVYVYNICSLETGS